MQGTIVVITPLISLMMDQRDKFTSKGVSTEFVGEAQEDEVAVEAVIKGNIYTTGIHKPREPSVQPTL